MCKCKYRVEASTCNSKQCWNNGKCRYECNKLIDKGICDSGIIWNQSNCEWECIIVMLVSIKTMKVVRVK